MQNLILILLPVLVFLSISSGNAKQTGEPALRHVVPFKFKDEPSQEDIRRIEKAFAGLADKIDQIQAFEWGINNSPENLNQGLTHCFFVTFASEQDRDDYLVHPDHKAFVEILGPHLDKVTVVDYWVK